MESLEDRITSAWLRVNSALRKHAWGSVEKFGLTPTQVEILMLLERRGGGLRLAEIARHLSLTPATVSDSLGSLVKKGLASKSPAEGNARALAVGLTEAGAQAAQSARQSSRLLEDALQSLDGGEKEALFSALIKIVRTLHDSGAISTARMCVNCRYFGADHYPDASAPHHCGLVNAPLRASDLRIDCPEHEAVDAKLQIKQGAIFLKPIPTAQQSEKDEQ